MFKVVKRIVRIIICLGILYLIVGGVWFYFASKGGNLPPVEDAPWAIQTFSNDEMRIPGRIYYASDIEILPDNTPVAKAPYWAFDGKDYYKVKEDKPFPEEDYGNISISRRGE